MNAEIIAGLVRHFLTAMGSYWVTNGMVGKDDMEAIAGGISVLISVLWSVLHKKGLQSTGMISITMLGLGLLGMTACTHVSTQVTRRLEVHPFQTNIITETTKTSAYSMCDSAQKIEKAMAKQTKTGQSAGFDGLDQSASTTNLNGLVESIASGIVKGMK